DEALTSFGEIVAAIMELAEKRLRELDKRHRTTRPASDLIVGLQCGGSDAFSGVTANPAVGYASDMLVRAGAAVMFSEVTEVRDAIHLLTGRAATEQVAHDFISGTLQMAAAMNMHIFTTGRGTPYGLAMVPVIKVSSRTPLSERWSDLIDIDAGTIATGDATIEQVGKQIFEMVLDVASGRKQ